MILGITRSRYDTLNNMLVKFVKQQQQPPAIETHCAHRLIWKFAWYKAIIYYMIILMINIGITFSPCVDVRREHGTYVHIIATSIDHCDYEHLHLVKGQTRLTNAHITNSFNKWSVSLPTLEAWQACCLQVFVGSSLSIFSCYPGMLNLTLVQSDWMTQIVGAGHMPVMLRRPYPLEVVLLHQTNVKWGILQAKITHSQIF